MLSIDREPFPSLILSGVDNIFSEIVNSFLCNIYFLQIVHIFKELNNNHQEQNCIPRV